MTPESTTLTAWWYLPSFKLPVVDHCKLSLSNLRIERTRVNTGFVVFPPLCSPPVENRLLSMETICSPIFPASKGSFALSISFHDPSATSISVLSICRFPDQPPDTRRTFWLIFMKMTWEKKSYQLIVGICVMTASMVKPRIHQRWKDFRVSLLIIGNNTIDTPRCFKKVCE